MALSIYISAQEIKLLKTAMWLLARHNMLKVLFSVMSCCCHARADLLSPTLADARVFNTDALERFRKHQLHHLHLIQQDPKVAVYYIIQFDVCDRGLSDCFDFMCGRLSHTREFPKKLLYFTNHSSLPFLSKDLSFMDWGRYGHLFHDFSRSVKEPWEDHMILQYPTVVYKAIPYGDWICDPSVWKDLMQPSAEVAEKVDQYIREDQFLVGIHIRSYWLLEHEPRFNNVFGIRAQDFLDCALSIRNRLTVSKPVRYFLATDSRTIAEERIESVPNMTEHTGPVIHTGTMVNRDERPLSCSVAEQLALLKVFVDFFVMLRVDFPIHTHGSSWSRMIKYANGISPHDEGTTNDSPQGLDMEQRPPWCDDHSLDHAVQTHKSDIK